MKLCNKEPNKTWMQIWLCSANAFLEQEEDPGKTARPAWATLLYALWAESCTNISGLD
jgi:hypothetical protein